MGLNNKVALQTLIGKPLSEIKCGVIKNPMDLKSKEKRDFLYKLVDDGFKSFGINKEDIDLKEYEGKSDELKKIILGLDMLWVTGGNVFYLRHLIKKVGLETILKDAITKGLVYGGDSAGALVICPTLRYLDSVDDTAEIPEVIYEGLNIIDFVPLPHWDNEKFKPALSDIKEKLENGGFEVKTFKDAQTIIVTDSKTEIVG